MSTDVFNLRAFENLGSIEIACFLGLVLFGVTTLQAYTYFQQFSNDHLSLKTLATAVLALELAHSCMISYMVYYYTVTLGGYTPDGPNSYVLAASIIPEALITALVQGFFAFRIYRLSGSLYISVACWSLSLLRLGGLLTLCAEGFIDVPKVPNDITSTSDFAWLITMVFVTGAVIDVLIAVSLCYYIKRLVPGEVLKSTSELVNKLMIWIIQTGMITSIMSTGLVICFHILNPRDEIWISIYMITTKLYSNSFFASLNMRQQIGNRRVPQISSGGLQFQEHVARLELVINGLQESRDRTLNLVTVPPLSLASHTTRQSFPGTVLEGQLSLAGPQRMPG